MPSGRESIPPHGRALRCAPRLGLPFRATPPTPPDWPAAPHRRREGPPAAHDCDTDPDKRGLHPPVGSGLSHLPFLSRSRLSPLVEPSARGFMSALRRSQYFIRPGRPCSGMESVCSLLCCTPHLGPASNRVHLGTRLRSQLARGPTGCKGVADHPVAGFVHRARLRIWTGNAVVAVYVTGTETVTPEQLENTVRLRDAGVRIHELPAMPQAGAGRGHRNRPTKLKQCERYTHQPVEIIRPAAHEIICDTTPIASRMSCRRHGPFALGARATTTPAQAAIESQ